MKPRIFVDKIVNSKAMKKEMKSKQESKKKSYTPAELADKWGISDQAVHKKIRNTLEEKEKNTLPPSFEIIQNRTYIILVPDNYRFRKVNKAA